MLCNHLLFIRLLIVTRVIHKYQFGSDDVAMNWMVVGDFAELKSTGGAEIDTKSTGRHCRNVLSNQRMRYSESSNIHMDVYPRRSRDNLP